MTDFEELERRAAAHPLPQWVLDYQALPPKQRMRAKLWHYGRLYGAPGKVADMIRRPFRLPLGTRHNWLTTRLALYFRDQDGWEYNTPDPPTSTHWRMATVAAAWLWRGTAIVAGLLALLIWSLTR